MEDVGAATPKLHLVVPLILMGDLLVSVCCLVIFIETWNRIH